MARITVEDCIDKVESRFELVLLAAHKAKELTGSVEFESSYPVAALKAISHFSQGDVENLRISSIKANSASGKLLESKPKKPVDGELLDAFQYTEKDAFIYSQDEDLK